MLLLALAASAIASATDPWAPVRAIVESNSAIWSANLSKGFVFTAGNATGRQFLFERDVKASKRMLLASASKFPSALAIAGAVAEGHLSFDTYMHEIFEWWSADASEPRSGVTLRQLLPSSTRLPEQILRFPWPLPPSWDEEAAA